VLGQATDSISLIKLKKAQDLIPSRYMVVNSNVMYELDIVGEFHVVGSSSLPFGLKHDIRGEDGDGLPVISTTNGELSNE
jgi:hypothetical protein